MQDLQTFRRARISTGEFPEDKRLAMWREVYARGIFSIDVEPLGDAPFHAEVEFTMLPGISIAAGSRSPAHYHVTRELSARGRDVIGLSILRSGVASATQFGKELIAGIGSASVLMSNEPSTSTLRSDGRFITLALSRPALAALVPSLSSIAGKGIPSDNAALRLLNRYLDVVLAGDEIDDQQVAHDVSTHILDLAALALGARGEAAEIARLRGAKAARFEAIRSDILARIDSSSLSADEIAARQGISPRYVRKLFEDAGSSFSSFVLTERLSNVRRMLVDRRYRHLNIAQIAHECGFSDVSYFNRVFRRHFGATPSDFRQPAAPTWRE